MVTGEVNLTCDAWQVENTDGYFAVTGHWIEETTPTQWELKSGLLSFTQVNNAHNGEQLGQALFKIIKQAGITHKVWSNVIIWYVISHSLIDYRLVTLHVITHLTILQWCRKWLCIWGLWPAKDTIGKSGKSSECFAVFSFLQLTMLTMPWSCLAHVINLATQALISTYGKSPHFDPKNPEAHVPTSHDEVGLVRAISVKVCIKLF